MAWPHWLHATLHPECFHGAGQRPPFFEGWYYKLVDRTGEHRLALIPGVFRGAKSGEHHSFVQVLDGRRSTATYCRYPEPSFSVAPRELDVRVGGCRFTRERIELDIAEPNCNLRGEVRLGPLTPWPATWLSPGVMGWYAWVPLMQCYHGIVSLDHSLSGELELNGVRVSLDGGRGYIEKDWGRAFPAGWIWMQSNHYPNPGTCVTASVAIIPWLKSSFAGFLVGVWHEGTLYRLTTYTGATIDRLEITDQHVRWSMHDRRLRLELEAHQAPGADLLGPTHLEMGVRVPETLEAEVSARLTTADGRVIFDGRGSHAGLEVCGDLPRLCRLLGPQARFLRDTPVGTPAV